MTTANLHSYDEQTSVLLVEDNLADARFVEEMLPASAYRVRHAASLASACEYVKSDGIRVVLLDLSLPDGHGLQTCLSMIGYAPDIPIVILTGQDDEDLALAAVKHGAQDYILKREITESSLLRAIRYAIERKSLSEQHAKLAAIVESTQDAIIGRDLNNVIVSWNQGATQLFGFTPEEIIGKAIDTLVPPNRRNEEGSIHERIKNSDHIRHYETVMQTKSGRFIDVSVTASPIKDQSGKIAGSSKIVRDISERKRLEAEAKEAAANLKMALRASKTGVWSWHVEENRVIADDQVTAIFALEPNCIGPSLETFLEKVHAEDRAGVFATINSSVKDRSDFHAEFRTVWPDESIHFVSASGQLIEGSLEMPTRIAGVCTDITKQIEEQEKAKRLYMLEQHEDFIATLSHDLKNPLIGANRLLEMCLNENFGDIEEQQRKVLNVIKRGNSEILSLLQNLLEVYRFDAGAPPLNLDVCDVSALAASCIDSMRVGAEEQGVILRDDFDKGDHKITIDAMAIRRVLVNLLSNAIKFTSHGGVITVSGRMDNRCYVLKVQDNGSGISPQDMELLFRRFSQTKLGRRHETGTGLGLYLCRQLIEAHQGTIICTSIENAGSTFIITLPVEHPND